MLEIEERVCFEKLKTLSFDAFREVLLYRRVVEWNKHDNYIMLDNGIKITIKMTDFECCAWAHGEFEDVKLEAVITDVTKPKHSSWSDEDTYGCSAVVKMLHNQNLICKVNANANAGNGGYYFSVASFIITIPEMNNEKYSVHLVRSDDDFPKEEI